MSLDLVLIVAGVVVFAFSFVDYYRRTLRSTFDPRAVCAAVQRSAKVCDDPTIRREITNQVRLTFGPTQSSDAWQHSNGGSFGWLGVLLVFAAALSVAIGLAAPRLARDLPGRPVVAAMAVVGLAGIVASAFLVPVSGDVPRPILDAVVHYGHGIGFRFVLTAAVVGAAAAALRVVTVRGGPGSDEPNGGAV